MTTCFIRILTADGLLPVDYSADSLGDAVQHEPRDGVYTVTNTYNTSNVCSECKGYLNSSRHRYICT